MSSFEAFQVYIALKAHFSDNSSYDFFKYSGKTNVTRVSFEKRKDRYFFEKLAKKFTRTELIDFFVANFISQNQPSWVGDLLLNTDSEALYLAWKKRADAISYYFMRDIDILLSSIRFNAKSFKSLFEYSGKDFQMFPLIITYCFQKVISLETLIILDEIFGFLKHYNEHFKGNIIWVERYNSIQKYRPFIKCDINNIKQELKKKLTTCL